MVGSSVDADLADYPFPAGLRSQPALDALVVRGLGKEAGSEYWIDFGASACVGAITCLVMAHSGYDMVHRKSIRKHFCAEQNARRTDWPT